MRDEKRSAWGLPADGEDGGGGRTGMPQTTSIPEQQARPHPQDNPEQSAAQQAERDDRGERGARS
ncbi:RNA polymerase subunit sigma-70, partial [Streptomyces sp. E11-3]